MINSPECWNPKEKPPAGICPKEFCCFWSRKGEFRDQTGKQWDDKLSAIRAATEVSKDGCHCFFGKCSRDESEKGTSDFYEPDEIRLRKAELPWFYFLSGPENIREEFRAKFLRESHEWWS